MKILVGVKRVVDYNIKVRVQPDGQGVDLAHVKMSMNPFDEIAVEEAVRQKEAGQASQVVVVSIGPQAAKDTLRTALAMGADRAILIDSQQQLEPLAVAKILQKVTESEKPDMVFVGKQAIDDDCNQTGQMLAALLGWGQATFASSLSFDKGRAQVAREVDSGTQTISVALPAVMTVDLRLNEPRYASLPNIMRARKKTIEEQAASDFNIDLSPRLKLLHIDEPQPRKPGIRLDSVDALVAKLKGDDII